MRKERNNGREITIREDMKIPGTSMILEKGDVIEVREGINRNRRLEERVKTIGKFNVDRTKATTTPILFPELESEIDGFLEEVSNIIPLRGYKKHEFYLSDGRGSGVYTLEGNIDTFDFVTPRGRMDQDDYEEFSQTLLSKWFRVADQIENLRRTEVTAFPFADDDGHVFISLEWNIQ